MRYKIIFKKPAVKFIKKLDKNEQEKILKKIKQLANNPKLGVPLMGDLTGEWKLRIGRYRLIYDLLESQLIIQILKAGHRKNIYN